MRSGLDWTGSQFLFNALLKLIFYWKAQLLIFLNRHSNKWLVDDFILRTLEN